MKSTRKCSKTSYFYFWCRSQFWDVPEVFGIFLRYPSKFCFKFCTFYFSPSYPFYSSFKVAGILLYNYGPIKKKLPLLKDLIHVGDALMMFCFDDTFSFFLGLWLIPSPEFGASWRCRCRWWHIVPSSLQTVYIEHL